MAVTITKYNEGKVQFLSGGIDLTTDTIKVALVTSSYTPNADTHEFFDDITNEITGTGYTAGGATLSSKSVTQDNTNDLAYFDAADASWPSSTLTARGAVIYKDTGTPGTSPLIAFIDFGTDRTSSADTFRIEWSASGILNLA